MDEEYSFKYYTDGIHTSFENTALMTTLRIPKPDDFHHHLRDGEHMKSVVNIASKQFGRLLVMPNLAPPVETTEQALAYRKRILDALPEDTSLDLIMSLYLTDRTSPEEIRKAAASDCVKAVKLYPQGATTNSQSGVTDISNLFGILQPTLEAMQDLRILLLIHGETADPAVPLQERERVFVRTVMPMLVETFPRLKIVLEHATTKDAVEFVMNAGPNVAATITAHHLLLNRLDLYQEGVLRPHNFCLPVLKEEEDRQCLLKASTSGNPKFFLGTDSAPHPIHHKEDPDCCKAGCFTANNAMEMYAAAFDSVGALDKLQDFACTFGAQFYGLAVNPGRTFITLKKSPCNVPKILPFGQDEVAPLFAGETLQFLLSDE